MVGRVDVRREVGGAMGEVVGLGSGVGILALGSRYALLATDGGLGVERFGGDGGGARRG